MIENAEL
jgi:hypothetical protein